MIYNQKESEKITSANTEAEETQEYFSNYLKIASADTVSNYYESGIAKAVQIGVKFKAPSLRLSLLYDITVSFDGEVYSKDSLICQLRGVQYTFAEMATMWMTYWHYGETMDVIVPVKYGIRHGRHNVSVSITYPGPTDVLATLREEFEVSNTGESY